MTGEIDWKAKLAEADRFHEKHLEKNAKLPGLQGEFYAAVLASYRTSKGEELLPVRNAEGELSWTTQQGVKAACYARQDASATLLLQLTQLSWLNSLRLLAWIVIAILAYIAYQVT
ncbi:MAG: hypothetical protein EON93_00180 [Burkholderiales bacterium]|nr:MAG: hypothetical protein EON93_00180 [Burkholderiales bacterium]